ncbi:proteoglycan Cow [Harmonia axyridis]|uniref:proteoglycan Cow n=1 Tax=Harmonia axyridis TaxID=115357 RepID=UPI001E278D5A|nr:proteoglycan Cow [Harmonia axyridis]
MKFILVLTVLVFCLLTIEAKRKRKFDSDFEFAEEDETKPTKSMEKKRWIHDPSSDLCRPLNCKKKEICLLEDSFTAVCVSRKELKKNGDIVVPKLTQKKEESVDEDDDDEEDEDDVFYDSDGDQESNSENLSDSVVCKPCPVVKPTFLCGSDNRTYSSLCRLDYHNCIHHTGIKLDCKGFCPCKENNSHLRKKQRQSDRLNSFMSKYKATLDKTGTASGALGGKTSQSKSDVYTFTPQDFKYENKHYKYIKYTKFNKESNDIPYTEDKDRLRGYNEVLDNKISNNDVDPIMSGKQCSPIALQTMGNRMLDWFSVVMADSTKRRRSKNKSKAHFPQTCKGEVRWMFQHLDISGDSELSLQELYDLEHDQSEVCLRPFLQQCDVDNDEVVSPFEWCRCFQRTERPCAAVKRKLTPDLIDVYVPECDSQGYYRSIQCHSAIGMCWCVDKHGVEFANTRTTSKPNCDKLVNKSPHNIPKQLSTNSIAGSDDEDSEDDVDQEVEGSADRPQDY